MIRRRRSEFGRDQRGGVAIFFGFALPVLLVGAGAAVEYASLTHRRGQLQKAADTAALTAARELTLANADDARVKSVAQGAAIASLTGGKQGGTSATVAAEVMDKRGGVRVTIHETITNIFGKVLTLPSSELEVRAAAKLSGGGRLCVMALDPTKGEAIRLDQNAKLTANGCSVQSNSKDRKGISAREYAFLSAERICSAGGYEGKAGANVSPAPTTDCPTIPDPLAKRGTPTVGGCDYGSLVPLLPKVVDGKTTTLNPGTYCGGLVITNKSNVTLSQGEYIIHQGPLIVEKGSTLTGEYVGFFLKGDLATLNFKSDSTISLSAPKTGTMAGLLVFGDPHAIFGRKFHIESDNARKLLGTIYLPKGSIFIDSKKPVADQSAYTVIVARTIELESGPNLVMNANYGATDVPVPLGVGPTSAQVSLSQ
jgi:hypothetical protein